MVPVGLFGGCVAHVCSKSSSELGQKRRASSTHERPSFVSRFTSMVAPGRSLERFVARACRSMCMAGTLLRNVAMQGPWYVERERDPSGLPPPRNPKTVQLYLQRGVARKDSQQGPGSQHAYSTDLYRTVLRTVMESTVCRTTLYVQLIPPPTHPPPDQ